MTDPNVSRQSNRKLFGFLFIAVLILGVLFVGFLLFYTFAAPERVANPADINAPDVPSEGVGVPDGGETTNLPNQAAPDSPAREMTPGQ